MRAVTTLDRRGLRTALTYLHLLAGFIPFDKEEFDHRAIEDLERFSTGSNRCGIPAGVEF